MWTNLIPIFRLVRIGLSKRSLI